MENIADKIRGLIERTRAGWSDPVTQANRDKLIAEKDARDRHYADKAKIERLSAAGIHSEHWPFLEKPEERPALSAVRSFLNSFGEKSGILVLSGEGNVGKSFAAAWAVNIHGGRMVQGNDLVRASNWDNGFWDRIEDARVLAIDELGTEGRDEKGWFDSKFFALIDGRLGANKKTILTTNLNGPAFTARYSSGALARLERRFKDFGRFVPVKR